MSVLRAALRLVLGAIGAAFALTVAAADFPAPKQGSWIAKDFRFHTGEVLPELKLAYTTVGDPKGEPVLMLHGTTGSAASMLTPAFGGELFGAGQPLDATKYYIIIPDAIGHGQSSKPSDGLRAKFPRYNYDDMVAAHHRLLTEHLGVKHLRLVMGNSMGGMHAWIWGVTHPGYMDALVPMASQPTEMSSRNWMMRRLIIDSIRNDPDYNGGNYTVQPRSAQFASVFYGIGTNGGDLAYQKAAPTREAADKLLDARLKAPFRADANDVLYQWDSSRDYNPGAEARAHRGCAAGDQRRRRRAQPARDRHHGARTEAREERQAVADPGERGHCRPRHHQLGPALHAGAARVSGGHSQARHVGRQPGRAPGRPRPTPSLGAASEARRHRANGHVPVKRGLRFSANAAWPSL
jgi:homoserine O-acetyltransferase